MAQFTPSLPFSTPLIVLKPSYTKVVGVQTKTFPDLEKGFMIYGSFKTYGGTEKNVDGIYSIIDTAVIDTWYRPDITSDCQIVVASTNARYEILGEPENINMRSQYMRFKVQRIVGGA